MNDWKREHLTRFIIGMIGYTVILPISMLIVGSERIESTSLKWMIALLPVIPFFFTMSAMVNNVKEMDELQQRIHLEALLFTTLITGGVTFSYGLIEASGLLPHLPAVLIAPFMIGAWGVAHSVIKRRYD